MTRSSSSCAASIAEGLESKPMIALFNIAEVVSEPASIIAPLLIRHNWEGENVPDVGSLNIVDSHCFVIALNKLFPEGVLCLSLLDFFDHSIPELFVNLVILSVILISNSPPGGDEIEEWEVGQFGERIDQI